MRSALTTNTIATLADGNEMKAAPINEPDTVTTNSALSDVLLQQELLKEEDLRNALALQLESNSSLGILLVRLGLLSEQDMATVQQQIGQYPFLKEDQIPNAPVMPDLFSAQFLRNAYVLPLADNGDTLSVAMADPCDRETLKALQLATERKINIYIATTTQIYNALDYWFDDGSEDTLANIIEEAVEEEDTNRTIESVDVLKDLADEAPVIRMVTLIINRAVTLHASDIHIEPFENEIKVRYRIDGVLQEGEAPPSRSLAAILSRIKIMAKLNIAERRLPQDGRIQLRTQGKVIDIRVSTVPTIYGESMVLRILDKQQLQLDFNVLGFHQQIQEKLTSLLQMSHGILLVTGPTGSGKTTTLYTILKTLNTQEQKILTVEDPVEYQLQGINQIQVKPRIGLNFSSALRSIVRQDPDIIMIGEMRDLETASIAVQSALTGHMVFSTLHTNDAGSSVTRLSDMGVEDYLLTSTLNGVLSQRLLRVLCPHCREGYTPLVELTEELHLSTLLSSSDPIQLYRAAGCDQCHHTGYNGRSVIAELLTSSEPIRQLIIKRADGIRIQECAIKNGMDNMQTDGFKKALAGITTIEEVKRVSHHS